MDNTFNNAQPTVKSLFIQREARVNPRRTQFRFVCDIASRNNYDECTLNIFQENVKSRGVKLAFCYHALR